MSMLSFKISLIGLNSGAGSEETTAEEIAKKFNKKPDDVLRNGVTKLYSLSKKDNLIDFTSRVAFNLLQSLKVDLSKIRGIFGSNNPTAKFLIPTFTACVADNLGLKNLVCDHVGAGCCGGMQALKSAYNQAVVDFIDGKIGYYLVIVGDQTNRLLDLNNFNTSIFFSEGAAALLLTNDPNEKRGYKIENIQTKSLLGEHLYALRIKNPYDSLNKSGGIPKLKMNGLRVFQFAVSTFPDILDMIGLKSMDENIYLIPHQANLRIIEAMIKENGLNSNHVYSDGIKRFGNMSGAAVFFGLEDALKRDLFNKKYRVLLGTFGSELQVGATLLMPNENFSHQ